MKKNFLLSAAIGTVAGLISGLFGGGGGMIVVPVLTTLFRYEQKNAQATAIAVMLPVTAVAAIVYLIKTPCDVLSALSVACGVTVGGAFGALLLDRTPPKIIKAGFALIMLATALKLLIS